MEGNKKVIRIGLRQEGIQEVLRVTTYADGTEVREPSQADADGCHRYPVPGEPGRCVDFWPADKEEEWIDGYMTLTCTVSADVPTRRLPALEPAKDNASPLAP